MDRRTFLQLTATAGAWGMLGPVRWVRAQSETRDLIVVSDTGAAGDGPSVSFIDPHALELLGTASLAGRFSFPATRWAFERDLVWSGLPAGPNDAVWAFSLRSGERVVEFPTGSSQNYTELTRDGRRLIVSARFEDRFHVLAADPEDDAFGTEVARLSTYEGASPCDITTHPDGEYAYAPDRGGDTLTVLRLDPFEIVRSIPMESPTEAPLEPYMATVSPAGDTLLVENAVVSGGSETGSESLFDLEDPAHPVEVARFHPEDGLGINPLTSEITPDGRHGIVICRDSSELTVIGLRERRIVASVPLPDDSNPFTGTFVFGSEGAGDRFFVPLPGRDAVAVVSVPGFEVEAMIPVGAQPQGLVYLHTQLPGRVAHDGRVGVALAEGRTFPDGCADPCCGTL